AGRADLGEAAGKLLGFTLQVTLLVEHLGQDAERAVVVLVVEQAGELAVGLGRSAGVHATDAGVHGVLLGEVQRLAGDDVHIAGGAAVLETGLGGLVHFHAADDLGRQQGVTHAAAHGVAL